jgi:hypothetical protein
MDEDEDGEVFVRMALSCLAATAVVYFQPLKGGTRPLNVLEKLLVSGALTGRGAPKVKGPAGPTRPLEGPRAATRDQLWGSTH